MSQRRRVLFVCTANSARSLMAEAILRDMAPEQFDVGSAGTHPGEPHPLALQCLQAAGLDTTALHSKPLSALTEDRWDYVITLCDKASRECGPLPAVGQMIAWDFADPAMHPQSATFHQVFKALRKRISLFVTVHQKASGASYTPALVFKALGDETRLTLMLLVLQEERLCVGTLTAALDASQPRISRQLAYLREAGLLDDQRDGQRVFYRLSPALPDWIRNTLHSAGQASPAMLARARGRLAERTESAITPSLSRA